MTSTAKILQHHYVRLRVFQCRLKSHLICSGLQQVRSILRFFMMYFAFFRTALMVKNPTEHQRSKNVLTCFNPWRVEYVSNPERNTHVNKPKIAMDASTYDCSVSRMYNDDRFARDIIGDCHYPIITDEIHVILMCFSMMQVIADCVRLG